MVVIFFEGVFMDKKDYKELIRDMHNNILAMQRMGLRTRYMNEKIFWDNLIAEEMYKKVVLEKLIRNMEKADSILLSQSREEKVFTLEELAEYTGKDGKPAYIAVNGVVYDITYEATWAASTHFGLTAGKDLTAQFNSCHGAQGILDKLKRVGTLK